MQIDFETVPSQIGMITYELSKNCALKSSLQEFDFGIFHKCNEDVFLLDDVFNLDLRTSLIFQL